MLDLTYLYAHKGKALRTHGFDEILDEEKIEDRLAQNGFSSPPSPFPVVVWRCTQACNLNCIHCYAHATPEPVFQELTTDEAENMIGDLAASGVSTLVFSGGEPLMRKDLFELARIAKSQEMGVILSTNGTLLTENMANELKTIGCSYVSVSLAGTGQANDYFRGQEGAFEQAVHGIKASQNAGLKVALRIALTRHNIRHLRSLFKFIEERNIGTVFFYHLFPSGRGIEMVDPTPEETHRAVDLILKTTKELNAGDRYVQVFVAGNVCDGAYLYKVLLDNKDPRAWRIQGYLTENSERFGSAGSEAACIDWNGNVHPNQFWLEKALGNIRTEKFLDIIKRNIVNKPSGFGNWETKLRGRCAQCRYVTLCMSGFQPAALTDEELRDSYPKCYLTEAEITY